MAPVCPGCITQKSGRNRCRVETTDSYRTVRAILRTGDLVSLHILKLSPPGEDRAGEGTACRVGMENRSGMTTGESGILPDG